MVFRPRSRGTVYVVLAALFAGSAVGIADMASATPFSATTTVASPDHYSAVIRRTDFGIPRITGKNFGDLGYGYAFAQDNIRTPADLVVTADGDAGCPARR